MIGESIIVQHCSKQKKKIGSEVLDRLRTVRARTGVSFGCACVRTYLISIYVRYMYVCSLNPALPGGREIRVNVHSAYMHIDLNAKDEMRIR